MGYHTNYFFLRFRASALEAHPVFSLLWLSGSFSPGVPSGLQGICKFGDPESDVYGGPRQASGGSTSAETLKGLGLQRLAAELRNF